MSPSVLWRILLVSSGILELGALGMVLSLFISTAARGPRPTNRPAYWSVLPFLVGACCALGLASIINLLNLVQGMGGSGMVPEIGDTLNVTPELFGFLLVFLFGLSGPCGWVLALCLAVNFWPTPGCSQRKNRTGSLSNDQQT